MRTRGFLISLVKGMLREVDKEAAALARRAEDLEEKRDKLRDLLKLAVRLDQSTGSSLPLPPGRLSASKAGALRFPIVNVEQQWLPDGSAVVTITHKELSAPQAVQKIIRLIPTAARAFNVLALQPRVEDGFPKPITLDELAERLSRKEGHITPRNASERLSRIREAFTLAGLNRHWIDRDDRSAIRLMWLRA
jgi:hypothetical protein